jgi:transcriptional regulator with XRE-family HTH domain
LREQLHTAWKESGLTLVQLLEKSGLDVTFVSLSRKLRGKQMLSADECEALARALGVELAAGKRRARA